MKTFERPTRTEPNKGKLEVFPNHVFAKNWLFTEDEQEEAALAHQIAAVAEKNGMSANDVYHLFPAMLRMLRSNIDWANPNKITKTSTGEEIHSINCPAYTSEAYKKRGHIPGDCTCKK